MTNTLIRKDWIDEPTLELRWDQRRVGGVTPVRILQQGWRLRQMGDWAYTLEWRDVPTVEVTRSDEPQS